MANFDHHGGVYLEGSQSFDLLGIQEAIDNWDRPKKETVSDPYLDAGPYVNEKSREAGVCAVAGLGKARMEEGICEIEATLPNASVGAAVCADGFNAKAKVYARAELASVSSNIGPVKTKLGLAADTGASVSLTGVDFQVLGTGLSIGRRTGFSFLGSEFSVRLW